jgi:type II secretory ATPase GspE/PulE/Tfp pilus assembly ATPase PilB-like protein
MDEAERQRRFRETEEASAKKRAEILGLEYLDMRKTADTFPLYPDVATKDDMYKYHIIPLREGNYEHSYFFGITTATPQSFIDQLRKKYQAESNNANFVMISNSSWQEMMRRYDPPPEVKYDDVRISQNEDAETLEQVSQILEGVHADDILKYLIEQAGKLNASDIHIENEIDGVRVRFRVDGTLHPVAKISRGKYHTLFSSIASAADLSTAATESQSGHIVRKITTLNGDSINLNMRIETAPTAYGQDVVMRLFNFDESMLRLDMLGLNPEERAQLDEIISHPRGMVMVVGPTGSGKSTTLYSILNALNDPDRKLITLEDPIEYDISGVTQIPVNTDAGGSFAEGFRSVLRLDPDVVMVGEIRDADTAKTAIQASITGHLVLSTFHAQDAAAAFARIIDMIGINPVFATAIRLVIGQRLVRKLDDATKTEYQPDDATKNWIREVLKDLPDSVQKPDLDNIKLWKPGKSEENPFGYKGRTVLMEQMIVNETIQRYLRGDEKDINASDIDQTARANGMITMLQKGVLKALSGETTIEEVNRVL